MAASDPCILVVDDDPEILKLVSMNLDARGYGVVTAVDGTEALKVFQERHVDLVILDLKMPGPDGFQVCQHLRGISDVPIVVVTATSTEADIIRAFDLGADDYVTKPFGIGELLARVRAAIRRGPAQGRLAGDGPTSGDIVIDMPARRVWRNGKSIDLTPRELSILSLLIRNPDRVLTHRFILESVWGSEYGEEREYVRAYMYRLRRKLEQDTDKPAPIVSVSGVGYMFASGEAPDSAPTPQLVPAGAG